MPLADVVLEIADEMEKYAFDVDAEVDRASVIGWVKQLQRAVKAAEGAPVHYAESAGHALSLTTFGSGPNDIVLGGTTNLPKPPPQHFAEVVSDKDPWDLAMLRGQTERHRKQAESVLVQDFSKEVSREERHHTKMTMLIGGDSDGTMLPIASNMPVDAHIWQAGEVYTLHKDGKMYFDEQETLKKRSS